MKAKQEKKALHSPTNHWLVGGVKCAFFSYCPERDKSIDTEKK
jgi:hypothetical protein